MDGENVPGTSNISLDDDFEKTMKKLEVLEEARAQLHRALQHAHFSLSIAQRDMDRVGLLLSWEAVPTGHGTVQAQRHVVRKNSASSVGDSRASGSSLEDCARWELVVASTEEKGDPALWFAAAPSEVLRESQRNFVSVVQLCIAAVQAQEEAVAAAAAYDAAHTGASLLS
uniref:Uncharacterized protein n=1 Tax=Trypanosoma congolense (strain IL3000) TaxID=1068625 RepID=G0UQ79_TRYCI|nr:conserved hypothetical protein [Trypanosoma congolense IL3000]